MVGESVAGLLSSLDRVITKASYGQDKEGMRSSALTFFYVSIAVVSLCWVCFELARRASFVRHFVSANGSRNLVGNDEANLSLVGNGESGGSSESILDPALDGLMEEISGDSLQLLPLNRKNSIELCSDTESEANNERSGDEQRTPGWSNPISEISIVRREDDALAGINVQGARFGKEEGSRVNGDILSSETQSAINNSPNDMHIRSTNPTMEVEKNSAIEEEEMGLMFNVDDSPSWCGWHRLRVVPTPPSRPVVPAIEMASTTSERRTQFQQVCDIAAVIRPYLILIFVDFFVTLAVYPGLATMVPSARLGTWMPVLMVLLFNAGDMLSRVCASLPLCPMWWKWLPSRLGIVLVLRFTLIPLLLLCVTGNGQGQPLLRGEGWSLAFILLTALSGGYIGNVTMSAGVAVSAWRRLELGRHTLSSNEKAVN